MLLAALGSLMLTGCAGATFAELHEAKKSWKPIFVSDARASGPNKLGAIGAQIRFSNTSGKTYKYVDFIVVAHNRVGDRIIREGDATPVIKLRFTGPLTSRRTPGTMKWPAIWYRTPIACLAIQRIDIDHMDGTKLALQHGPLAEVLSTTLRRGCHGKST